MAPTVRGGHEAAKLPASSESPPFCDRSYDNYTYEMRSVTRKPTDMFDRDFEWMQVVSFAADSRPGATLGVVSGRRRQGKTFLLRALCQATGGFYFAAEEAADGESLHRIGSDLGAHLGTPAPLEFGDWREVADALLTLSHDGPVPVVIDEFPYLARANPSLPSIIQNAFGPLRAEREQSRTRLLLCGSALSFMGGLLAGSAPLRGRAVPSRRRVLERHRSHPGPQGARHRRGHSRLPP